MFVFLSFFCVLSHYEMFLSLQIISLVSSVAQVLLMLFTRFYIVKSVVNEYCGILSGGILAGLRIPCVHVPRRSWKLFSVVLGSETAVLRQDKTRPVSNRPRYWSWSWSYTFGLASNTVCADSRQDAV